MAKVVGAKITLFKLLDEGKKNQAEIEKIIFKEFPNTKRSTLNRYLSDYRRLRAASSDPKISEPSALSEPDTSSSDSLPNDNSDQDTSDQRIENLSPPQRAKAESGAYDVKEFSAEIKDTDTPKEAGAVAKMYKDGMTAPEPVHLEFIPKIFKRSFKIVQNLPFIKKKLAGWNDEQSVNMLADEVEGLIKKRIHVSSRNSDVWNVVLAAGVVGVSMGAHIVYGEKHDLSDEKKIIEGKGGKGKTAVAQLNELEGMIDAQKDPRLAKDPDVLPPDKVAQIVNDAHKDPKIDTQTQ